MSLGQMETAPRALIKEQDLPNANLYNKKTFQWQASQAHAHRFFYQVGKGHPLMKKKFNSTTDPIQFWQNDLL